MKKFEGLLKSEIKKVEAAANKATRTKNCKLTGYYAKITRPFDFAPEAVWVLE